MTDNKEKETQGLEEEILEEITGGDEGENTNSLPQQYPVSPYHTPPQPTPQPSDQPHPTPHTPTNPYPVPHQPNQG